MSEREPQAARDLRAAMESVTRTGYQPSARYLSPAEAATLDNAGLTARDREAILADRLAQERARAERAEARVERVREVLEAMRAKYDGAVVVRFVPDSDSEGYGAHLAAQEASEAPGGRDESMGLSEALEAADDLPAAPDEPTWSGLFGIDPTFTGGLSIDEFLDESRGDA